jgi:ABC-2 type transport system ATP-binding protein
MPPSGAPIVIDHLTKRYGRLTAVDDLNLTVEPGEIFGFLGLNGAGKTTTIRVLLDLLRPTGGRAAIFGFDCQKEGRRARARVGYQPGEPGFYDDMTGGTTLDLLGRLNGREPNGDARRRLLERFDLSAADLGRRIREYSTGMKRKLAIVQAFDAQPPLLVLDEPTEGLDPLMQEAFYELLGQVKSEGRTVFMSSHVLSEIERVCDRVGLLREGKLALVSTVDGVRRLAPRRIRIRFDADVPADRLRLPDGSHAIVIAPRLWTLAISGPLGPMMQSLAGLPIADIETEEPHLEEVLVQYYRQGAGT